MKPDSMLVEPEHIVSAHQAVSAGGGAAALEEAGQCEPALANFLGQNLVAIAGKLALAGAPTEVVQGVHEDVLTIALTCLQALQRGHYALWRDSMVGTHLAQLDEAFQPPARPRRKKKGQDVDPG